MLIALLVPLVIASLVMLITLIAKAVAANARPSGESVILGAVTGFFDTLGIGSFTPTMAWLKFRKLVPDRIMPPTMLVAQTPAALTEGIIFLILLGVLVDPVLLLGCSLALLIGGLLGVSLVNRARVALIQLIVGIALVVAAFFYALSNLGMMPSPGAATSLPLTLTILAIVANFIFGVLLNFGVGNYAPTLAMFSLMGLDPRYVFPIMAGGAGLCGAVASTRHLFVTKIDLKVASGVAIGGIPAVLVAAFLVKEMPLEWLRWLVIVVVLYAAVIILKSAFDGWGEKDAEAMIPVAGA